MKKLFLFIIYLSLPGLIMAQNVGINSSGASPDASAGLDIDFSGKGILIPRLALTQTSSASPVTSPATSLVVYNTATANDVTPGFYYWDGTQWVRLLNGTGAGAAWMTNGNAASGSDFLGTTSNFPLVVKTNNTEVLRVQANGTTKITGTAIGSPGIWMDGTVTAAASTAYGILSRGTLIAAANGDSFLPFSTNLGSVNTGTFTGLTYAGGHFDGASCSKTGTGTIDNAYGIYVTSPSIGTNNYGGGFFGNGSQLKLLLSSGSPTALTTIDFGLASPTDPEGSLSVAAAAGQFSEFAAAQDVVLRARKNNLILCTRNVSSPTTGDILFGTGMPNTEKMRITNGGFVGIGTTSPGGSLHVVGTLPNYIDRMSNQANEGASFIFRKARGTTSVPTVIQNGDELAKFLVSGYDGSSYVWTGGMSAVVNGAVAAGSVPTDLVFGVSSTNMGNPASNETMRITNTNKVGISNSNPAYKVDINLTDGDGVRMSSTLHATFDANAYENVIRPLSTNNTQGSNKPNSAVFLQGLSVGCGYGAFQIVANASTSDPLIYCRTEINNSGVWNPWLQMAAYNSSGNLGINTTSPTAQLDVNGSTGYNQIRMRTSFTPANSADANGNIGDVAWDDNFVYVKTSTGWKRTSLSAF